jgi:hypothetical protein
MQEASFSANRRGTLAVLPSMDIDCSVRQLNQQASKKGIIYEANALARLLTFVLWSTIPRATTSSKLTPYGAGLLETEWNRRNDYNSARIQTTEWRVAYDGHDEEFDHVLQSPFISTFVPQFKRVRVVEFQMVGSNTYLVCDCDHFTRTGMPCHHIWHLNAKYWNEYSPRVTDIHPMWHSSYKAYTFAGFENETKLPASPALERFAMAFEKNVPGPTGLTQIPVLDKLILMLVIQTTPSFPLQIGVSTGQRN